MNWQGLRVKIPITYAGGSSVFVGSAPYNASTVTINDVFVIGKPAGADVSFQRTPLGGSWSCSGTGCPIPTGYNKSLYAVTGTQTITVDRMAKTLRLDVLPNATNYDGDTVYFTARSTDSRPVAVREWIWSDSTGTHYQYGCSGTTCSIAPTSTGMMYVVARVGTNAFVEQASADAEILPVTLAASIYDNPVLAGDSATVVIVANPSRPVTALSMMDGLCDFQTLRCRTRIFVPGTITISATVNGRTHSCEVSVDTLPCPAGHPDLDMASLRRAIDSLWKLTNFNAPPEDRREQTAYIVDSAGVLITRYIANTSATPCSFPPSIIDLTTNNWVGGGVMKIVRQIHTHPIANGELTPSNCDEQGMVGTGPSRSDWSLMEYLATFPEDFAPGFSGIAVEHNVVWSFRALPLVWKKVKRLRKGSRDFDIDSIPVPTKIVPDSNLFSFARDSLNALCVSRIHKKPTYTK